MSTTLAVDWIEREGPSAASPEEAIVGAPRPFTAEEIDPLASLIARLDREIERRDYRLDEPFTLVVSRRSSVPLALCGTKSIQLCDQSHAGRCRRECAPRSREWRAELDAANSGPDGRDRYELVYRVRWTSDWYRDDFAAFPQSASEASDPASLGDAQRPPIAKRIGGKKPRVHRSGADASS
jgi:hypothetical protein